MWLQLTLPLLIPTGQHQVCHLPSRVAELKELLELARKPLHLPCPHLGWLPLTSVCQSPTY